MMKTAWIPTSALLMCTVTGASLADRIDLVTGDTLLGKLLEETPAQVVMEHPILGRLAIPREQVKLITRDADEPSPPASTALSTRTTRMIETPATAVSTPSDVSSEASIPPDAPVAPGFFAAWKSTLDLGLSGEQGASRKNTLRVVLRSKREVENYRTRFSASYHMGTDRGRRSRQEFLSSLGNDWLMNDSPWFFFSQGQYQYDEFKDWQHRLSGEAGAGYQFLGTESMKLTGRSGPGASIEVDGDRQGLRPEWMVGIEWEWVPAPRHKITLSNVFIHDLLTMNRYRNKSVGAWTIRLDEMYPVNLRFSVENEYDASPLSDRTYNDLKYFGSLQWEF